MNPAPLRLGDPIDDIPFTHADGRRVHLSDYPGRLLLVFLRHWQCITCQARLHDILNQESEIRQSEITLLFVAQKQPMVRASWMERMTILTDPDRSAYTYFGLCRMPWTRLLRPGVILRYIWLIFRGWIPRKPDPDEDLLLLGGDFVISAERTLIYAHRSAEPTNRPDVKTILNALRPK